MPDYCSVTASSKLKSYVRRSEPPALLFQRHAGAHDVCGRYAFSSSYTH